MKFIIQITAISIVLALTGFLLHEPFTQLSMYQLQKVQVVTLRMETDFELRLIFALSLGFIPVLYAGMRALLKINQTKQIIFAVSSIFITGIIFWQYKIVSITQRYEELDRVATGIKYVFARENLNLELYLLLGFILGAVIGSISLYRYKKRN